MRILLSMPAQEKLKTNEFRSKVSVEQLVSKLESLNASNLESSSLVRRVKGTTEEIYVMRIAGNLRAFLTKKGKDIVLLGIENG